MANITSAVLGTLGLVSAGWAVGCGGSGGSTPDLDTGSGPVCPGCRPTFGGETTDFGGGDENCSATEEPLREADANELGLDAVLAAAAAPLQLPLRWYEGDAAGAPPSSLTSDGETTLSATFELGEPAYFAIGAEVSDACRDAIRVPVTVSLDTEDGGLAATLQGTMQQRRGEFRWELRATADLAGVSGNRELAIDTSREHIGRLTLVLNGFPGERRGRVAPEVLYLDGEWAEPSFDAVLEVQGAAITPFSGEFPGDECGSVAVPIDVTETHSFLANQTVRTVYDRALAAFPVSEPALTRDGELDQVTVDIDPEISGACLGTNFGSSMLTIRGAAEVANSDGQFTIPMDRMTLHLAGNSGEPASLILERAFEAQPTEDLARAMGLRGDFSSHETLSGEVRVDYEWTPDGVASSGRVVVRDGATLQEVERLTWPAP